MEEEVKVEVQEEPTGGGVKEEITIPLPTPPVNGLSDVPNWGGLDMTPMPVPNLPMGTITETITIPATLATPQKPRKVEVNNPIKEPVEIKKEPSGEIKITREICDGEVHLGPFKSCLKEFTGVTAVGWIAAAAGLIVLWKWLDWRFKK